MNNPKNDSYYLQKIINDLDFIIVHMADVTEENLQCDEVLLNAMLFSLIQIQENSHKLSDEFKTAHSDIPWTDIAGLRNRIVHDYGNVDFNVVYNTLKNDIPVLKLLLSAANS